MDLLEVESHDGTRIAAVRGGAGPPLLLIHGATADHSTTWRLVGPLLEERFSVYRMDRRGRKNSGDADDYAIEREFEDVAALVEKIGSPVSVVGHSYGAEVALGALTLTSGIDALVHYEGGIPATHRTPEETIGRLEDLIAAGDRDAAVTSLFRDLVGIDPDEMRLVSGEEAWQARVDNVHTLPRELRSENDFDITTIADHLRKTSTRVLLLLGGDSAPALTEPSSLLAEILPNCSMETIPGETHAAMLSSPESFVEIVTRFLTQA